jgi:hypothetical protein
MKINGFNKIKFHAREAIRLQTIVRRRSKMIASAAKKCRKIILMDLLRESLFTKGDALIFWINFNGHKSNHMNTP